MIELFTLPAINKFLNQLVLYLEINLILSILIYSLVAINTIVIYPKQEKKETVEFERSFYLT